MDEQNLPPSFSFRNFLRENLLIFLFGLLGLVFLAAGLFSLSSTSQEPKSEIIFEKGSSSEEKIKVEVAGAVVRPGVYDLTSETRVQEALILAGGLSSQADRDWVAKNLNLAAKLTDGAKIYIPDKTQNSRVKSQKLSEVDGTQFGNLVNINTGSQAELEALTGVGPVTAQKIISGRPYQNIEELLSRKIVGASTFTKIKEEITAW